MNRLNVVATLAFYINTQEFSANNISTNLFCVSIQSRFYCRFLFLRIQLIQKRLSFNNLKLLTLSAQGMTDVAYLEPWSGQIP